MLERLYAALHVQDLLTSPLAVLDVLLLAVVIYQLLLLVRGTRTANMMIALAVLVVFYLVTKPGVLSLNAFHTVLGTLLAYIPIAVIVLFQRQIRQALSNLGRNPFASFLPIKEYTTLVEEVALASASLASKRLGALIVIERDMGLRSFYETGISLDAEVSYDLLMNIFTYHSPLHDGAAVIAEGRIKAASCPTLSRTYGTRHRAAFGITEESDALAVIVSEERGVISLVDGAEIVEHLDAASLQQALLEALGGEKEEPSGSPVRAAAIPAGSVDA